MEVKVEAEAGGSGGDMMADLETKEKAEAGAQADEEAEAQADEEAEPHATKLRHGALT